MRLCTFFSTRARKLKNLPYVDLLTLTTGNTKSKSITRATEPL